MTTTATYFTTERDTQCAMLRLIIEMTKSGRGVKAPVLAAQAVKDGITKTKTEAHRVITRLHDDWRTEVIPGRGGYTVAYEGWDLLNGEA